MDVLEAIRQRRSVNRYSDRPVHREQIETLLEAAVWAPNHRMTEPWAFYVLGPETRALYAGLRARLKAEKVDDPDAAAAVRRKIETENLEIPALVAVASLAAEDPLQREEDFAATWMGIQNLLLAAWDTGLAGYIRTGRILGRAELRQGLGIPDDQRLLAIVQLGEPARVPDPKPRVPAREKTRWLD